MQIGIKQVDAFTDIPLTGNPAGVVLHAEGLTDREMQAIAAEMALSETAFLLPPTSGDADVRLRWFTTTKEVPLCGHATIATFHAMAEEGEHGTDRAGETAFRVETRSGILPVCVDKGAAGITVHFGLLVAKFRPASVYTAEALRTLNLDAAALRKDLPVLADEYLYIPLTALRTLFDLHPDFTGMSAFLTKHNFGGICAFTTETVDAGSAVHSRFFAPSWGINEDPVTGSANGPLGVYLFERGIISAPAGEVTVIGEQGDAIGRRGRVAITVTGAGSKVTAVEIAGRAVTVFSTELRVR
jgi:trans-2,3-dihydro-3-hydroxyanthranilate isomerase